MWALIQNGMAVEVTDIDPTGRFHASFQWQPCGAEVRQGWAFLNGVFSQPVVDLEELVDIERAWRNAELSVTEWLVMRHRDERDLALGTTLTAEQFADLLGYRQTLRDWPVAEGFPGVEQRPVAPPWLAETVQ
jgi:hypothetical protein